MNPTSRIRRPLGSSLCLSIKKWKEINKPKPKRQDNSKVLKYPITLKDPIEVVYYLLVLLFIIFIGFILVKLIVNYVGDGDTKKYSEATQSEQEIQNKKFRWSDIFDEKENTINKDRLDKPSSVTTVSSKPIPLIPIIPEYPNISKRTRIEGTVIVEAYVDKKGFVKETIVLKGIDVLLDEAAISAVKDTRFKPAKQMGRPVAVWINIPLEFKL